MDSHDQGDVVGFEIGISFVPGEGNPKRVFQAMSGLIEAFERLDAHLLETLGIALQTELVLDEIESGSIKARFRDLIKGLPDEALKDGDWKKLVGHYLVRGKYRVLKWLEHRNEVGSREDLRDLEVDLRQLAEETDIKQLPAYTSPRPEALLSDIRSIQASLEHLDVEDEASYTFENTSVPFNNTLRVSSNVVREVLTKEVLASLGERILKIKKPDYLGQSMWEFYYGEHRIEAKIVDENWLAQFHRREFNVKPGDSLRVSLYEAISYGYEGEVVHRHYEIRKVHRVIRPRVVNQRDIDFD